MGTRLFMGLSALSTPERDDSYISVAMGCAAVCVFVTHHVFYFSVASVTCHSLITGLRCCGNSA